MNSPTQANPLPQTTESTSGLTFVSGSPMALFGESIGTKYTMTLVVLSPRAYQNLGPQIKPGEIIDFAARARKEWGIESQSLPPECQSFVAEHDLANEIKLAADLAKMYFPLVVGISFTLEHDPEVPDSWIEIRVKTQGTVSELLDAESRFSAKWVSETLPSKRYLIRLSLDAV